MDVYDFKTARKDAGYTQGELAIALETPKRTIQDWESGKSRVPGVARAAMKLLMQKDIWVMRAIKEKIERDMDSRFPRGFQSECCLDEEG